MIEESKKAAQSKSEASDSSSSESSVVVSAEFEFAPTEARDECDLSRYDAEELKRNLGLALSTIKELQKRLIGCHRSIEALTFERNQLRREAQRSLRAAERCRARLADRDSSAEAALAAANERPRLEEAARCEADARAAAEAALAAAVAELRAAVDREREASALLVDRLEASSAAEAARRARDARVVRASRARAEAVEAEAREARALVVAAESRRDESETKVAEVGAERDRTARTATAARHAFERQRCAAATELKAAVDARRAAIAALETVRNQLRVSERCRSAVCAQLKEARERRRLDRAECEALEARIEAYELRHRTHLHELREHRVARKREKTARVAALKKNDDGDDRGRRPPRRNALVHPSDSGPRHVLVDLRYHTPPPSTDGVPEPSPLI